MLMVQMEGQYQFLYEIVREQFVERYPNLLEQRSLDLLSQSRKKTSDKAKWAAEESYSHDRDDWGSIEDDDDDHESGGLDVPELKPAKRPRHWK